MIILLANYKFDIYDNMAKVLQIHFIYLVKGEGQYILDTYNKTMKNYYCYYH